jgi:transketolase
MHGGGTAATFNRGHAIIDHYTYFLCSDGDLMEGVSHEACSFAGHLKLGKLIGIYDDNHITIDGKTEITFSDDTAKRFESYGWHVQRVPDGNDIAAIDAALVAARRVTDKPSLIVMRTHIGFGSPNKQDTPGAHGAPLGEDEVKLTKQNLGWPSLEPFHVPEEALTHWRQSKERGAQLEAEWKKKSAAYRQAHPDLAAELERRLAGRLPDGWDADLPVFTTKDAQATRAASGQGAGGGRSEGPRVDRRIGRSGGVDQCRVPQGGRARGANLAGRNMHFGIREHGMGAIMNGMALHGGVRPLRVRSSSSPVHAAADPPGRVVR